jgi:type III pantothenate kinase
MGLFSDDGLKKTAVISGLPEKEQVLDFCKDGKIDAIAISSVGQDISDKMASWFPKCFLLNISSNTPLPIKTNYQTPSTLGIDRICGVVAGNKYFPGNTVLVIDMGTCITYDLIDANKMHLGGGISPGYKMRLDAMHTFTSRLPQADASQKIPELGTSTIDSLLFGAGQGMKAEIDGMTSFFSAKHPNLKVILTGGNHLMVEQGDENAIFAAPNLILEGIHEILLHNEKLND